MVIGRDLLRGMWLLGPTTPHWAYQIIFQLSFENGKNTRTQNISKQFEQTRKEQLLAYSSSKKISTSGTKKQSHNDNDEEDIFAEFR